MFIQIRRSLHLLGPNFQSRSLIDLNLRNKFGVNIVGIIHNDHFFVPSGTDNIEAQDVVVIVGTKQQTRKVDAFLNQEAK